MPRSPKDHARPTSRDETPESSIRVPDVANQRESTGGGHKHKDKEGSRASGVANCGLQRAAPAGHLKRQPKTSTAIDPTATDTASKRRPTTGTAHLGS